MKKYIIIILAIMISTSLSAQTSKKDITVSQKGKSNLNDANQFNTVTESLNLIIPFGSLGELVKIGFGFTVEYKIDNYFEKKGIVIGAELGYYNFDGKERNTDYLMMVPVFVSIGYRFGIKNNFYFLPELFLGCSLSLLNYNKDEIIVGNEEINYTLEANFKPAIKTKLRVGYIGKLFFFSLSGIYGNIIESKGLMQYAAISLDAGVKW